MTRAARPAHRFCMRRLTSCGLLAGRRNSAARASHTILLRFFSRSATSCAVHNRPFVTGPCAAPDLSAPHPIGVLQQGTACKTPQAPPARGRPVQGGAAGGDLQAARRGRLDPGAGTCVLASAESADRGGWGDAALRSPPPPPLPCAGGKPRKHGLVPQVGSKPTWSQRYIPFPAGARMQDRSR